MEDPLIPPEEEKLKDPRSGTQVPVSGPSPSLSPGDTSPSWGANTKLIIGLSLVAISLFLLTRFMNIIGPLVLAFMLAYLLYPIAESITKLTRIPWRVVVSIIYLIIIILVLGSIAISGLTVIDQVTNLINFLKTALTGLPEFITNLTSHPVQIGPFTINTKLLDLNVIGQEVLGAVQPILTQAGTSVVAFASSTATAIGWLFFIELVSYFILVESGGGSNRLINLTVPGHDEDIRRLSAALGNIWNAFLRGQVTIVLLTILIYNVLLGSLGLHYFFGLALLAGLARFIPYVGPFVAWTSYGLVAFFQGTTIFGLSPLGYVALIVGCAWVMDMIMDNFIVPRLMSNALKVHPAAVMVSALVGLNLMGVIGVILAAPVLATVKLFLDYVFAKLFDQDPWVKMETIPRPNPLPPFIPLVKERYEQLRRRVERVRFLRSKEAPPRRD